MDIFLGLCGSAVLLLAFGFIVNGFPNIHIGSKNYYDSDGKKKQK